MNTSMDTLPSNVSSTAVSSNDTAAVVSDAAKQPKASCLFVTLGCAKNQVDTDRMRALLLKSGFEESRDAESADVVIINTCSFLESATSESIEVTLDLAQKRTSGIKKLPIIMCGCVPSRYGAALDKELPEVSAFVKATDEDSIVGIVSDVLGIEHPTFSFSQELSARALRTIEGTSAFVKISEGCDRYCAFCAIPFIRGHYASRCPEEIFSEITMLMEGGVKEIILIGQDTGIWGEDLSSRGAASALHKDSDLHDPSSASSSAKADAQREHMNLAWLLREVARIVRPYKAWIRVLYLQPEGMTEDLIATIRDTPEVLPYIDIPIQHCNERLLKKMGRSGSASQLHKLFAHLRHEIPHMVLRTTGMVGFPTETDEEAAELVDFFKQEEFDYMSVFSYSQELGTTAAKMRGQVSAETKLERTQTLRDTAEELGFAATAKHVGEVVDVIIDSVDMDSPDKERIGHAWFQAPDCDGCVHILDTDANPGDVVRVKLKEAYCYELVGELV